MNDKLTTLFNRIKADSNFLTVSEAQTSQGIVLPILNNLGWDVFDTSEVMPEYSVAGKRVDFALRIQSQNKVFLEIKKTSEDLEKHHEQLVYYAFQQGVKLAILTNGITWQFYLPLEEGGWEQRKFFTIDLLEQSVEDAIEKFENLLLRKNIESGDAYHNAKLLYDGRQKNKIIKENLPKAWHKLISEPDEMLVELLNETLEKICGYKAEDNQISNFLQQIFPNVNISPINSKPKINVKKKPQLSFEKENLVEGNIIKLNGDKFNNLLHTKIIEVKLADSILPNNWRSSLDACLKLAFKKGLDSKFLQDNLNINIKQGSFTVQGFSPIEGTGFSFQNQDANSSANNILKLAKILNYELYILFEWKEKGIYPKKQGLINWKP